MLNPDHSLNGLTTMETHDLFCAALLGPDVYSISPTLQLLEYKGVKSLKLSSFSMSPTDMLNFYHDSKEREAILEFRIAYRCYMRIGMFKHHYLFKV